MLNAYEKANNVNLKDPYATYEAAKELARAYDNVIAALEASGVDPDWPGNTYGAPVWTWKGTGSATATFTCKTDSSLVKKMTAAITSKVTKQATYSAPGKKTFTATVTLNGKTFTDTKTLTTYVYSNEWVNGLWYNKDGTQTYKYKLSWKKNKKGWWVEDTNGWYPTSRWQKINGTWYYFRKDGYMAANEWYDGYWLSKNGAWTYKKKAVWKRYGTKWMYRTSDWYAKGQRQKIDGTWYGFDLNGYLVSEK
jgi:glucan-binding YG repeat protein